MDDMCIDNFLVQCSPRHVERHSDSSDFENSYNIPVKDNIDTPIVAPKDGCHRLIKNKTKKRKNNVVTRRLCDNFQLYSINTQYDRDNIPEKDVNTNPTRQVLYSKNDDGVSNYNEEESTKMDRNNNKRDHASHFKAECDSNLCVRNKIVPSFSTILRRPNYYKTRSIPDNYNYCDTGYTAFCDKPRTRTMKPTNPSRGYPAEPIYAVANEIPGFQFQRINDYNELSQRDPVRRYNSSDYINDYGLSSGSDQEDIKPYKHKRLMKYIMHRLEKQIAKEYSNPGPIKHEKQQYPSKLQVNSPYQVFATSSCQTKNASTDSDSHSTMPSNSSEFWDFLLRKIKYQIHKAEVPKYTTTTCCDKESCQFYQKNSNSSTAKPKSQPKGSKQMLKKGDSIERCFPNLGQKSSPGLHSKKSDDSAVICKCLKPNKSCCPDNITSQENVKPCQADHDTLKKTLAKKYKGEVLCIHNPPCVLINGCLNLPQPKTSTPQGTLLFPVTHTKRSSFAQMCRKMKLSKQKCQDQAIQYEQPSINYQEYIPEFRTEKIVQSACNHNPPCEVVRGCQKLRFNPTLQTSCVHVPMCQKLPECVLEQRHVEEETCNHTPKCAELPLCTRKYIALIAKENATTQVKPKTKIGCRHQPPCILIPKCIAQAICGDWYPGNAIPGCVHQPSCEMIPACFRKQVKESVSVQSQYPSASCRIV